MPLKNPGPCVVKGCESHGPFRKFTENAKNNSIRYRTCETYNYIQLNDQLCQTHYLLVAEPYRGNPNKKRRLEESGKVYIVEDDD